MFFPIWHFPYLYMLLCFFHWSYRHGPLAIQPTVIKYRGCLFSTLYLTVIYYKYFIFHFFNINNDISLFYLHCSIYLKCFISAHPNCVLFITHGGLLSTTEAIHYAVPIIGIPVFGDQFNNVNRAVKKGFGKLVKLSYAMADDLENAIHEIITDTR